MRGSKQSPQPQQPQQPRRQIPFLRVWIQALPTLLAIATALVPHASHAQSGNGKGNKKPPEQRLDTQLMEMQVGELQILDVPDALRIVVGNSRPVNVVTTEEQDVIIFAREPGQTQVQVWSASGRQFRWQVRVSEVGARQTRADLQQLIARMPNVQVSTVGDKLIVEGQDIADADRARLALLRQQYPQILDLTSQLGWNRMVLLDVQVVEIPRSRLRELGLNWQTQTQGGMTVGLAWDAGTRQWGRYQHN